MKFRPYHLNNKECCKWNDVSSIKDMLGLIFPKNPYKLYHQNSQEEKTICVVTGCTFKIQIADSDRGEAYLMMLLPDNVTKLVVGFIAFKSGEIIPDEVVFWNEEKEKWESLRKF